MTGFRIAMVGTRGVPARYGGFETAVEEIGTRLARKGHNVTVFCRGERTPSQHYEGMRLVHLPAVPYKTLETLSHTTLSVFHKATLTADVVFLFNAANAPLLSVLRAARRRTAVHVDGLESQRSKWGPTGKRYYSHMERLAVRWADALIADAKGIQDYYAGKYGASSIFIPYGAPILQEPAFARLGELSVSAGQYHLVVARFEPENHVDLAISGYIRSGATMPLIVVGSAPYSHNYVQQLQALAAGHEAVRMVGPVWDQDLLDALYAGAITYIHGHSVGGTNPSLLRAMGAGAPVAAYDVSFNREVLGNSGVYWRDAGSLAAHLLAAERDPLTSARGRAGRDRAAALYTWDSVADDYERLAQALMDSRPRTFSLRHDSRH